MPVKKITKDMQGTVAALAGNGASVSKITRETGLHSTTVKRILQEPAVIDLKEKIEERLASKFELLAESILDSVSEDDLIRASLQQKSISAACMIDKSRILRGQSSVNIALLFSQAMDMRSNE